MLKYDTILSRYGGGSNSSFTGKSRRAANDNCEDLCTNAREKVLKEFDSRVIAKKYIDLYEEILDEDTPIG